MILSIALAIAPFFSKLALYLLTTFMKKGEALEAGKKAVIQAAHDYNAQASQSAGISMEYADIIKKYVEQMEALNTPKDNSK